MFVLQSEPAQLFAGLPVWFTSESPQRQQQQAGEPARDHRTAAWPHGAGECCSVCVSVVCHWEIRFSVASHKLSAERTFFALQKIKSFDKNRMREEGKA